MQQQPPTKYDRIARYLVQRAAGLLFSWLLRLTPQQLQFKRWLPTQLTLPGAPERLCDAIAELIDLEHGGRPVAALVEIQAEPDPSMPGRLLLAGGLLTLTVKPTPLPGDRYELLAVVINLTGAGDAARSCVLGRAAWTLRPAEVNLATVDAGAVLDEIVSGAAPRELLAFIPLLQRGEEVGIIQRWRKIVQLEPDPRRRADFALARIYAERVGRMPAWKDALEDIPMNDSPILTELLAGAEAKGMIQALLRVLLTRFKVVPPDLSDALCSSRDIEKLNHWLYLASKARSMARFRQEAGV